LKGNQSDMQNLKEKEGSIHRGTARGGGLLKGRTMTKKGEVLKKGLVKPPRIPRKFMHQKTKGT